MSCDVSDQADGADVDLLESGLDEAAAGVDAVDGELLFDLEDARRRGIELVGIHANLVFAGDAAETGNIHHIGDGLELLLEDPVLDAT